jgi:hypothetical protein
MDNATRHKLIWGWLRLLLGLAQMFLTVAAAVVLFTIGLHPLTWALIVGATSATIVSRLIYHGKAAPELRRDSDNQKPGRT